MSPEAGAKTIWRGLADLSARNLRKWGPAVRVLVTKLPLKLPLVRLVEDGGGTCSLSKVCFSYQGERLHTSRVGAPFSTYRAVYRVLDGRGRSRTVDAEWRPEGVSRFEVHGQCAAAFSRTDTKVAEFEVEANVPSTVRLEQDQEQGAYLKVEISGESVDARLTVRTSNFQIIERKVGHEESGWESWQNRVHLNYLLDVPESDSGRKKLTVVFSSLGGEHDFTYNYRSALQGADSYRLYLLDDFGRRGSYYFADHKDLTIYEEVQAFLSEMIQKLGVSLDRVIFAGSSKGGTAALLHGSGLGVGKIVVGAPQVYAGSYLQSSAPAVLGFIAGGHDAEARKWLDDSVVTRLSSPPVGTAIRILVGTKDHHLKRHIEPLLDLTRSQECDIVATVIPDLNHGNIGSVYRHYLANIVSRQPNLRNDNVLPYRIEVQGDHDQHLEVEIWKPRSEQLACHLYRGSELVEEMEYSEQSNFLFPVVSGEDLRVKIFRRRSGDARPFAWFYSTWIKA